MQDEQPDAVTGPPDRRPWRHGGLLAALAVLLAVGVGIGVASVAAGDGAPVAAPTTQAPTGAAPAPSGAPATVGPPPSVAPGAADGSPRIVRATAADLQWTRANGFLTCSGLVINVRATTTGEVTKVLAQLLRISGGSTTRLTLSGSDGTWSASSLELNAPSEWKVRVVAIGPGGRDERLADITAPDGGGTTLRHVCDD